MDLFATAGLDLPHSAAQRARPYAVRSLRVPLFAHKVVEEARSNAAVKFAPTDAQKHAASEYARKARKAFGKLSEVAVRPIFISSILETVLGYTSADPDRVYSLAFERPIRLGAVDVALGRFDDPNGLNEIIAPFELKGPKTLDLDGRCRDADAAPCSRPWTRPARIGYWSPIASKSDFMDSAAAVTPTRSSTSPSWTGNRNTSGFGCCSPPTNCEPALAN